MIPSPSVRPRSREERQKRFAQIDRDGAVGSCAAEGEEPVGELGAGSRRLERVIDELAQGGVARHLLAQQAQIARHHRQDVVEVVRGPARELAYRLHALDLPQPLLGAPLLLVEPDPLEAALERRQQILGVEGLREIIIGARLQRLDRGLDRRIGRHHDGDEIGRALAQKAQEIDATLEAEPHIDERDREVAAGDGGKRRRRVGRGGSVITLHAQQADEALGEIRIVVDDEDAARRRRPAFSEDVVWQGVVLHDVGRNIGSALRHAGGAR